MSASEALNVKHERVSGSLSILGLLLITLSLVWDHPISTYVVLYFGAGFVVAGAGFFLYSFAKHLLPRRHT